MFSENISMIMMKINMLYPSKKGKNGHEATQKSSATPNTGPRTKLIPPGFQRTGHRATLGKLSQNVEVVVPYGDEGTGPPHRAMRVT